MEKVKENIADIVNQVKQNEKYAWDNLYNATFREAYFVAIKVTGNEQEAVDLVHDAYIAAFEKIGELKDPEKFQTWLNMIVANRCRDYLRKMKPTLFSELQAEDDAELDWTDDREDIQPEKALDHSETVQLIAEMIDSLPEDQKLCITLFYRDELTVGQIAEALEVSEGTVKSRLNYARQKVKAKVQSLEKQGVKLYSIAPIPLLIWLLKYEAAYVEVPAAALAVPAAGAVTAGTSVTAAAGSGAAGASTSVATTSVLAKVVAGIAAVSIVAGGAALYEASNNEDDISPTSAIVENTEIPTVPPTIFPETTPPTETTMPENPLNILEETLDFSKAWVIYHEMNYGVYITSFAFEPDGTFYFIGGFPMSECDFGIIGSYQTIGSEIELHLDDGDTQVTHTYIFDPETLQITQISEEGLLYGQTPGTILQLQEDMDRSVARIMELVALHSEK